MSSSRSSKSRKAEGSSRGPKETVNGNDGDSDVEEIEIDSDSEGDESSASDYKPKKQRECGFNKAAFSMPDDIKKLMERVTCCSCGKQLNPMNPGAVRKHPWLKVITCKKCYKFLRSGPFTRDDDGLDEQCRWCGEGGRLYGCDFCHNCFCRTCIKRNMGRTEAAIMENDDHSKWHCYMCKPKKISKLVDDCEKILGYIEKEEKKEKEREERAKQREKEKAEKYKEKRKDEKSKKTEEKESRKEDRDKKWEKEDKDEKSTPKRGLPAPRGKSEIAEKISSEKDVEKSKGSIPQSKSMTDLIVVEDNPLPTFGPLQKHHRAVEYKPDTKSGVTLVQKASNGVTEVHVGPKNDKVVVVPFVNRNVGRAQNPLVMNYNNKPILAGMLTQQTRGLCKIMAPQNDIKALKNNIMPYNIENITERMANIAQSFSLTLNSAKTDLAIAKLSQPNMVLARQTAAAVVKNGFENFFSQVREVFNVQVVTNFPQVNVPDLNAQGDVKTVSGNLTSTPNAKKEPKNLLLDTVTGVLDESAIPIEIDEPSPVKKPGPMKEKMEVDVDEDGVVYVTDNESKEVKVVPLKDDKEEKEVNGIPEDVKDHAPELSKGGDEDKAKKNKTNENKDVTVDKSDGEVKTAENDETADTEDEVIAVSEEEETETRRGTRSANKVNDQEQKDKKDEERINEDSDSEDQGKVTRSRSANKVNDKEQKDKKDEERINEDSDSEDQGKVTRRSRSANKVNDKECSDKKDEEKNNEDSEVEEQGKVTRRSRKANKVNEKDKKDKVEDVDNESEEIEYHKEVEKKTKSSVSSKKGADKDEGDKNKTVDEESEKGKKSDKKGKNTSKGSDDEKLDENKKDKEEENEVNMDQSENTAAELELLKEMEEEFNAESDEPRRSLRRRKKDESESKDGSDNDSPVRRSSRQRQKPEEGKDTDKGDKKKGDSDSKKKKDKDESVEKDLSKDKKKKVLVESDDDKTEENNDFDDDNRASSAKDKKNSKSPKKSVNKSKLNIESEESNDTPKVKSKKDIKASKNEKEKKSSKNDRKVDDDDIPMEESDTTETSDSDESVAEFGKVKRRRKPVAKEETSRTTRHRGKKSEPSDSDSDFNKDLEKEIKSLSKETRLSKKKAKEAKESKTETKGKKEKPKEKETEDKKKGKKDEDDDDDDDDDSDSSENEPEILSAADDDSSDEDTDKVSASQLKKLKQTGKAILEDDSDEDYVDPNNISDDSSDPEISFPKLSTPKKGKRAKSEDLSDDSDFITPKKKRQRVKDKLLDAKVSDSDSDFGKKGKKGKGKKGKGKRKKDDSDQFSELSDEDENRPKGKGKKRKRIKKIDSSDEEGAPKEPGEDDNVGSGEEDGPGGFLKRKQIRKVKSTKKLAETTKAAQKAEEDRRKRIEERQKEYNTYVEVEGGEEEEEVPEGTEREMTTPTKAPDSIAKILGSPRKIPVTTKCVLEMDKETKKPLIEVDKTLIRKLKPHQVEAVRFMYNCCVESIERLKKGDGSGCILAHCMGLGKTLSVISFVHTMLRNVKLTKMSKCLVVCPLNTVLNWVNEFEIWLDDVDFEIEVYEMSKVKQNFERAQMLKEWHEGGAGVMILGYDMYRNLVNGSHCKNKKQKKIFYDSLADPGPDIVVCDEGHILKNDATSLSKAMTKIKTPRRIVLTGTPLQNNLGEYHCMVSFVKPSLLGTRKEFNNRFNNPITNGQCSDSTPFDVKLMKRRAHILHELLAGCVQRKDYSALTKYLPPKFEYVISVRLSTVQMTLYEKYLDMVLGGGGVEGMKYKGARLFTDYQALMRIWTHPWVLKLDEIRQENKRMFDDEDEDSFIDDSNSEDDSFIDDGSTTSESNDDDNGDSDTSKKKKGKGKRKTRSNKKGSSSSDDDSKKEKDKDTGDEVVKKWTSKRRGNEEGAGSSWMMDMGYGNADEGPKEVTSEWWAEFVKEGDEFKLELSGKLTLMFEILKMCEDIGDKVLVFSQSLLSLDIIEDFLSKIDEANQEIPNADKPATSEEKPKEDSDKPKENGEAKADGEKTAGENPDGEKSTTEKTEKEKLNERLSHYGKSWARGADYFRMDGSTNSQNRKAAQDMFNNPENYRARLFLISTKAGSLGINLVAANRVIIFDASWNPSHDIQSIFRVYRFGQVKPVYVYRFLAQGTMEAKIYERQVTKQSLSQRVVDEHQIERHFTANDLQELYKFQPDRLDDPNIKERPLLALPKDHMLAELMTHNKEWIVSYHEHDSLLENVTEQELTEEEKKAAWEDYEDEKKGISRAMGGMNMNINPGLYATQQMNMQNLLLQGQANLGQAAVLQIVQDLKTRFPNLPPEVFQQRVQAVLRQVLTQQIMAQSEMQRRQIMEQSEMHRRQVEAQRMAELQRLNQIKQQIQRQQAMINSQQRAFGMAGMNPTMNFGMGGSAGGMQMGHSLLNPQTTSHSNMPRPPSSASIAPMLPDQHKK